MGHLFKKLGIFKMRNLENGEFLKAGNLLKRECFKWGIFFKRESLKVGDFLSTTVLTFRPCCWFL